MQKFCRLFFVIFLLFPGFAMAQQWDFIKEKDGIKIYTKKEKDSDLKSFRGVTDMNCSFEDVCGLVGNVKNVNWWDKSVRELKILAYEKDKYSRYYLIYDTPWPLSDRDLVVEATINTDYDKKIRTVYSAPLNNVIPEKPDLVRIKKYWQKWNVQATGPNSVHIVLEGFVDPGGSIPSWLYNMVITETPLKIIHGIQDKLVKK